MADVAVVDRGVVVRAVVALVIDVFCGEVLNIDEGVFGGVEEEVEKLAVSRVKVGVAGDVLVVD